MFGDAHGNVVHLFERDCSLQRRHQKVIEEAPAPGLSPEMREVMGRAAVEAARAVGYVGAGTVEFIADSREGLRPDRFFFMEMNTRLQVEHPVTEAITSLDLVELQFRVASGEALPFAQDDLRIDGHAVEARLYAEDPEQGFLPSTGKLWALRFPDGEGIRVDTGVVAGDEVTPFYDPMIAKVIAHGANRDEALDRLANALGATLVAGPRTNVAFLKALCDAPEFRSGHFDTGFIDRNLDSLTARHVERDGEIVAAGAIHLLDAQERALRPTRSDSVSRGPMAWEGDPWRSADAFQLVGERRTPLRILVENDPVETVLTWRGSSLEVAVPALDYEGRPKFDWDEATNNDTFGADAAQIVPAGRGVILVRDGRQTRVSLFDPFAIDLEHLDAGDAVKAPMHGKLVALYVAAGDRVEKGQRLAIVEAMKMEHALVAPRDGEVQEVSGEPGGQVAEGARVVTLTPLAG